MRNDDWNEDIHGSVSPHEFKHLRSCLVELLEIMGELAPGDVRVAALKQKALGYIAPRFGSASDAAGQSQS